MLTQNRVDSAPERLKATEHSAELPAGLAYNGLVLPTLDNAARFYILCNLAELALRVGVGTKRMRRIFLSRLLDSLLVHGSFWPALETLGLQINKV